MIVKEITYMDKPCMIWLFEDEDIPFIQEICEEIKLLSSKKLK